MDMYVHGASQAANRRTDCSAEESNLQTIASVANPKTSAIRDANTLRRLEEQRDT